MGLWHIQSIMIAVFGGAGSVNACEPDVDPRSAWDLRAQSQAVSVDPQCRVVNAGIHDDKALGAAEDLGNGRVLQVVNDDPSLVLLADCNTREATLLQGKATVVGETLCGNNFSFATLTGPTSTMLLTSGNDLHELVDMAIANGAHEWNPIEFFFTFRVGTESRRRDVGAKDRFNLLCGCRLLYPDSAGAQN